MISEASPVPASAILLDPSMLKEVLPVKWLVEIQLQLSRLRSLFGGRERARESDAQNQNQIPKQEASSIVVPENRKPTWYASALKTQEIQRKA